jgi:hypothetical protein
MKILFLDFDGPLFSDRVIKFHSQNSYTNDTLRKFNNRCIDNGDTFGAKTTSYWKMDEVAVGMLNTLMDISNFRVVVSSTWRQLFSRESIEYLFLLNDLRVVLHDDWCTRLRENINMYESQYSRHNRRTEIEEYISRHSIEEYVILDDPSSGMDLTEHKQQDRVVLVNPSIGMELEHYSQLRDLLV